MDLVNYWAAIRRPELIERYKQIRQERRKLFEEGCREHKMHTPEWGDQIAMYDGRLKALREMISRPTPIDSIEIEAVRKATPDEMKNAPRSSNSKGANNNKTQCQYTP